MKNMKSCLANKEYHIYTLSDPNTLEVRYVGCSVNPIVRYSAHLSDKTNKRKSAWIDSLTSMGLKPILKTEVTVYDIKKAALEELRIFNIYDNGNLVCNNPVTFKYVHTGQVERLTHRNKKDKSPIVSANIKKLMALNRISTLTVARRIKTKKDTLQKMLDGELLLDPALVESIRMYFSCDKHLLIQPDAEFQIDNSYGAVYSNRWF